jgi:hypothetical protein
MMRTQTRGQDKRNLVLRKESEELKAVTGETIREA